MTAEKQKDVNVADDGLPRGWAKKREVAAYYGVSGDTLDRWHDEGIGPPRYNFGEKLIRYKSADVRKGFRKARP